MIVQENRTPDNLFGVDAATHQKLPNAHLATYGLCKPIGYSSSQQVNLTSFKLAACWDPDHSHQPAWNTMWDYGRMDGACATNVSYIGSNCQGQLARCSDTQWDQYCPQYTYVDNTLLSGYHSGAHVLDPYFQIAQDYGFANYMFQTNQGPSFPAHQFLLSGTSAPDQTPQTYFDWFAAENPLTSTGGHTGITGCAGTAGEYVFEANTTGTEAKGYTPPGYTQGFPCYDHPTLVDLIKHASLSWKYYTETNASGIKPGDSIWTAPNAIRSICLPLNGNGECNGTDWANVILPGSSQNNDASPILNDLGADGTCNLPNVSWVIPDGQWSDHPGSGPGADGGPGWVAAIVNAVGNLDNDGNPLQQTPCMDNIGGQNYTYWQDTVILITWDDWGGFYDDVVPRTVSPLRVPDIRTAKAGSTCTASACHCWSSRPTPNRATPPGRKTVPPAPAPPTATISAAY